MQKVAGEPPNTLEVIEPAEQPPRVANGVRPLRGQPPQPGPSGRTPRPSGRTLAARAIAGEATPPQPPLPRREPPPDHTPTAGPKLRGRPAKDMQTRFAPSFVMICLLLAVGLVVSLILWATIRPNDGDGSSPSTVVPTQPGITTIPSPPSGAVQIVGVTSFDPESSGGNGEENEELAPQALADGDPATNWTTECYSNQYMGKSGAGLVITLPTALAGTLSFDVGHAPYQVDVFATADDSIPGSRANWGQQLSHSVDATPGHVEVAVPTPAKHVLILVMEPGRSASGCNPDTPHQGMIGEVAFTAAS